VLPGASAVLLAVVASGLPCHAFGFWGYLPNRSEPRRTMLQKLGAEEATVVVFETPHRIHDTLADLEELLPDREIALGRELTKLHETWYRGTPTQVKAELGREDRGEMVLVLSGAAAKRVVTAAEAAFDGETLPVWARAYLAAAREGGMTLREAVKPLAKHLGLSASELYRLASALPAPVLPAED
jgi:16S rRNA (cytidine1402-2'-O)-methyltransferase